MSGETPINKIDFSYQLIDVIDITKKACGLWLGETGADGHKKREDLNPSLNVLQTTALLYLLFRTSMGTEAAGSGAAGEVATALLGFAGSHSIGGIWAGVL